MEWVSQNIEDFKKMDLVVFVLTGSFMKDSQISCHPLMKENVKVWYILSIPQGFSWLNLRGLVECDE